MKWDISGLNRITDFIFQFLSNGKAKTKLAILTLLYFGEFVENPNNVISQY